jgi:olefin beta-lactone synthetase
MTIGEMLREQARRRPDTVALIDESRGRTLTFVQLEDAVAQAAAWWGEQGLRRGQAALVFVPMSADLYVALLALFRIGAVALFLDPSAGAEHIERCCDRWPPNAFLAIPKAHLLRLKSRALRRIPLKVSLGAWIPGARRWPSRGQGARWEDSSARPEDPALVTFTSGSTGVPKAAVRTQAFLIAQFHALAPNIALESGDVDYATLPIFALANLAAGVTTVIPSVDLRRPGAVDASRVFAQLKRSQVNRITASPAFFEQLIERSRGTGETLPMLRKIYSGGAPVFPRLLSALGALAPHAKVVAVYGSTEAEPIADCDVADLTEADVTAMRRGRGLIAGTPVPQVHIAVIADEWGKPRPDVSTEEFKSLALPVNEIGEIVVSGDHVLKGYLGGVGNEETKFRVGAEIWHRTGDAGCLDERGRLWLHGRCAARIDDAQGRLYPFGVECVAMTFPEVKRAAVLAHRGSRILIVEVGVAGLEQKLLEATRWAGIARVAVSRRIPVDPRHNAKIDYPKLHRQLGEER